MSGKKIIESLEAATRGDFTRVTVAGYVWVRDGVDKVQAWDAVAAAREDEREKCAAIAEHLNGWGFPPNPDLANHIAKEIRARGVAFSNGERS